MTPTLHNKLTLAAQRVADIEDQMARQPSAQEWRRLSREHGSLLPLVEKFRQWRLAREKLRDLEEAMDDPELSPIAEEEMATATAHMDALAQDIKTLLSPPAKSDKRNCFLEIRAAVGGNESSLFAGELHRLYCRYAESKGWTVDIVSHTAGEMGGYKEIISRVVGARAYGRLKFESGAHRVQRVPLTESQGRVHTSVVTVAVLAEPLPEDKLVINPADLRVETFRASGAGGQHVNTTDSAVRITHLPTGVCAECQDDRSQHKNREKALSVLAARVAEKRRREQQEKEALHRRRLVGSGERSDKIRTYNFPQGRLTDHRIGLTVYKLQNILEGDLDHVLDKLARADEEDRHADLAGADEERNAGR